MADKLALFFFIPLLTASVVHYLSNATKKKLNLLRSQAFVIEGVMAIVERRELRSKLLSGMDDPDELVLAVEQEVREKEAANLASPLKLQGPATLAGVKVVKHLDFGDVRELCVERHFVTAVGCGQSVLDKLSVVFKEIYGDKLQHCTAEEQNILMNGPFRHLADIHLPCPSVPPKAGLFVNLLSFHDQMLSTGRVNDKSAQTVFRMLLRVARRLISKYELHIGVMSLLQQIREFKPVKDARDAVSHLGMLSSKQREVRLARIERMMQSEVGLGEIEMGRCEPLVKAGISILRSKAKEKELKKKKAKSPAAESISLEEFLTFKLNGDVQTLVSLALERVTNDYKLGEFMLRWDEGRAHFRVYKSGEIVLFGDCSAVDESMDLPSVLTLHLPSESGHYTFRYIPLQGDLILVPEEVENKASVSTVSTK